MLETIREFAAERLGPDPELRLRHAEHYLEVARSAGLTDDSDGAMRHDLIVRDRDNVRAALDWALDSGAAEVGLRLARLAGELLGHERTRRGRRAASAGSWRARRTRCRPSCARSPCGSTGPPR